MLSRALFVKNKYKTFKTFWPMVWPIFLHIVALEKEAVFSEERKTGTGNISACLLSAF